MTTVGQRALVAYERTNGRYDLHYAHWGAHEWHLATALAAIRPGGPIDPTEETGHPAAVEPEPLATDRSFADLLETHVDWQTYDACYVVASDGTVQPYLAAWFGLPGHDTVRPRDGALVSVDPARAEPDGEFLRGRVAGLKAATLAMVRDDRLTPAAARSFLASEVRSWHLEDRTVHLGPDADPDGWRS
ncbi:hypothetical protein BV210_06030 [Halorientalis sp. IM1011]|uniref:DUF6735 family protein n=1 Tax=Halorientalis sp. IM1011 TaxID=1932360 RepID=UPI00097CC137|nr:DUF6735 family protein [Halorientalis sp. IM1011]AQL42299.1 hypothetical protein BV210_06030 [Halorientalis sp. IM1011]